MYFQLQLLSILLDAVYAKHRRWRSHIKVSETNRPHCREQPRTPPPCHLDTVHGTLSLLRWPSWLPHASVVLVTSQAPLSPSCSGLLFPMFISFLKLPPLKKVEVPKDDARELPASWLPPARLSAHPSLLPEPVSPPSVICPRPRWLWILLPLTFKGDFFLFGNSLLSTASLHFSSLDLILENMLKYGPSKNPNRTT